MVRPRRRRTQGDVSSKGSSTSEKRGEDARVWGGKLVTTFVGEEGGVYVRNFPATSFGRRTKGILRSFFVTAGMARTGGGRRTGRLLFDTVGTAVAGRRALSLVSGTLGMAATDGWVGRSVLGSTATASPTCVWDDSEP